MTEFGHSTIPEGHLLYAVGDIHGQLHLLDDLLGKIEADAACGTADRRILVFVGDYIDRGPDSAGVVARLIDDLPASFEAHFLLGNHEEILLQFLKDPEYLPLWLVNGAETTLASYGVDAPGEHDSSAAYAECRDRLLEAMPTSHKSFYDGLELTFQHGDYLFVHAGIRPGVELERQKRKDLIWIREGFLDCDEDLGHVVVHGHTPAREPEVRPNRIGIDTGAVVHGRLTALKLWSNKASFLHAAELNL